MITADRLHTVEEYYFSKKLREVNALKAAGAPIINLGIGSPDLAPPKAVITAINQEIHLGILAISKPKFEPLKI